MPKFFNTYFSNSPHAQQRTSKEWLDLKLSCSDIPQICPQNSEYLYPEEEESLFKSYVNFMWYSKAPKLSFKKVLEAIYKKWPYFKSRLGYVYLLQEGRYYKIGSSQRPIALRLNELNQTPNSKVKLIGCTDKFENYKELEKTFHREYADCVVKSPINPSLREWFNIPNHRLYYITGCLAKAKTFPSSEEQLNLTQAIQPQFKVQPLYFERLTEFLNHCKNKNIAFSTTDLLSAIIGLLDNQPKYEKTAVESLLVSQQWRLSKAKLSDGSQPSAAKWSFAPLPVILTRTDLKQMFEGWDLTH